MYKIKIEKKKPSQAEIFHDFYMRVTLVGPSRCGKTALMKRLMRDYFSTKPEVTLGTDTYAFTLPLKIPYAIAMEEPKTHVTLSELSGNQRYGAMWASMMTDTPMLIFMYDCQVEGSYEKAMEFHSILAKQEQWKHTTCILMAGKADKYVKPVVPFKQARKEAHSKGWLFFKTSAKDNSAAELTEKFSRMVTATVERWWPEDIEDLWAFFAEPPHVTYRFISQ